jgi:uncharacterized membrane protein
MPPWFMQHRLRQLSAQMPSPAQRAAVSPWTPVVAVVAAVCLPIAFAAIRAAAGRWVPTGDDAYFTVRSRDVLTEHHPLLGAWSSGSVDLADPINNLGPTQLDVMAPFTKVAPMGGTAIATALTNIASIVTAAWLLTRLAGRRAVIAGMVAVGLLTWTMGSEMLITPRQHQYLVLPYLCLLVAAWAVTSGDRLAIVPAVAAASLVAQTHLSYPVLVAALTLVMLVGQVVTTRAGTVLGGRRSVVVGASLAFVLWIQTLIDQVAGSGNLGNVLFGSGGAGQAGLGAGIRLVAGLLVSPVTLFRSGYARDDTDALMADTWQLVVFAIALIAALVAVGRGVRVGAWRRTAGAVVAVVAVVAGVVDATLLPRTVFGLAIMNYRWAWATGAFIAIVCLVELAIRVEHEHRARSATSWVAFALCVTLSLANLPRSVQHPDPVRYLDEQRAVAEALDQLAAVDLDGPVIIDESEMYFGHPYTYPVLLALQQQHVAFRFESPLQERRFGKGRVSDGTETLRLRLVSGDPAVELSTSPNLIAFVPGVRPVAMVLEPI